MKDFAEVWYLEGVAEGWGAGRELVEIRNHKITSQIYGNNTMFASLLVLSQGCVYAELGFIRICIACGCLYLSRAVKSWIKGCSHPKGGMWQLEWIMTP